MIANAKLVFRLVKQQQIGGKTGGHEFVNFYKTG